jgi:decaprenyl-phosphate phosphoribosyltransferase
VPAAGDITNDLLWQPAPESAVLELVPPLAPPRAVPRETVGADAVSRRRNPARALLRAMRPRQWSKNVLVLAAPCAAGMIDQASVAAEAAAAFAVMCMISSATYLLNDVRDREQDRAHPRKRLRPIAAGELSPRVALLCAAALVALGLALAVAVAPALAGVALLYLALTVSYSLWWRSVPVLDMLVIAAGFVLRALAGGAATDIYLSRFFVLVTACCAVYLVAAKRLAELRAQPAGGAVALRTTLRSYSASGLRVLLSGAALGAGAAYWWWAFTRPAHVLWYALSACALMAWLARYALLVAAGVGEAPEELILKDRVLLATSFAWAVLFIGGVYAGS